MYQRQYIATGMAKIRTKTKTYVATAAATIATIGLVTAPAFAAAPFTNGSFEVGTPTGAYTPVFPGDTTIGSWQVTAGSVDLITTYWTASNGTNSVDLNGWTPGTLSQTFATVSGHSYKVMFDLAGNPDGGTPLKTLNVSATGGATTPYSFDTTGHSDASMGWQPQTYNFTANSNSTTLTFASTTTVNSDPFGPALDNVTVSDVTPASPTSKDQCKNGGWKVFTAPGFKNQGQCIDWVQARARGDLRMSGPSQRIVFNVANEPGHGKHHHRNTVEYWNYSVNLNYKADVTCAVVNPQANDARFMYQIPAGNPYSGTYVVVYVKHVPGPHTPDVFSFEATSDQAMATQWCQTGVGFVPTAYPVTQGEVHIY